MVIQEVEVGAPHATPLHPPAGTSVACPLVGAVIRCKEMPVTARYIGYRDAKQRFVKFLGDQTTVRGVPARPNNGSWSSVIFRLKTFVSKDPFGPSCQGRAAPPRCAGSSRTRATVFLGVPRVWGQMADKMRVVGRKGNWAVKWLSAAVKRVELEAAVNRQVGGSRAVPVHALFEVFRMAIFGVIRHKLGFRGCSWRLRTWCPGSRRR